MTTKVKTFHFNINKYGVELLMDLGSYKDIPNFFFEKELHNTDFYEIIFFSKGDGFLELDNNKIPITANSIVFISPFQKRKWFVEKSTIDCHFLIFKDTFLSSFFSDKLFAYRLQYFYNHINELYFVADKSLFKRFNEMFAEILSEIKNYQSDSPHIIRALLYFMLIKLNRFYSNKHKISTETQNNIVAFQFKELLESKLSHQYNVDFYALHLGISRVSLNNHIKKQFGITASEMIANRLFIEIKSKLLYTSKTISEIAVDLKFSEPNHLTRFFKRISHQTPNEFRLAYQNGRSFI